MPALEQLVLMAPLAKESVFQPRKVGVSLLQTKWLPFLSAAVEVVGAGVCGKRRDLGVFPVCLLVLYPGMLNQ